MVNQLKNHIALIGFMGAGKSCIARELSARYGRDYMDLDDFISALTGETVSDIFSKQGEQHFRILEFDALEAVLDRPTTTIVACGGGIVTNPDSLALLKSRSVVVYLRVNPQTALARIDDWSTRPLLSSAGSTEAVHALAQSRLALYEAASDISVNTDKRDISAVADCVVERLKEAGYASLLS